MIYKHTNIDLQDQAKLEAAHMSVAKNEANIAYIAMMADVEIPESEEETENV